jgi:hypothetical protein
MRSTTQPHPEPANQSPRRTSWIPAESTGRVGIDPARWSTRVQEVALWRAMDGWYRRRITH